MTIARNSIHSKKLFNTGAERSARRDTPAPTSHCTEKPVCCDHAPALRMKGHTPAAYFYFACLVIFATVLPLFSGCSKEEPYTKETFVMGTRAWVTIYGQSERDALEAAGEALRELHRIESVMSNWKMDSEISMLNGRSGEGPFTVSSELFSLVDSSLHYSELTFGAFDITARPLVKLWGFQGEKSTLPSDAQIRSTLKRVDYRKVAVDRVRSTITLPSGMELDLAGVAKGYGVDRCSSVLRGRGVKSALVNLGGNIYALGAPPGRKGWKVGIRDPLGGRGTVGSILLKDRGIATSGNYENFVEIEGIRYGHIIDPHSGWPVENVLSVTVIASTALASDALSTGLFVLGPDRGRMVLEKIPSIGAIFAVPGDGEVIYNTLGNFDETPVLRDPGNARD